VYDQWTLSNGLRVIGERMPHIRSCTVGIWLPVGSALEDSRNNGLSHFIEHMLFKGTEKRSARIIAEEMDSVGGHLNAFTGKECTCIHAKVLDENLSMAIDILSDLVLHSLFTHEDIDKERLVILEEIAMNEDTPEDVVHEMLASAQFCQKTYGMPILGTECNITRFKRSDIQSFYNLHYCPSQTVISIAGNYSPDEFITQIDSVFGQWKNTLVPKPQIKTETLSGTKTTREKDIEQLHICLGFPGLSMQDERNTALSVFNNVVGGSVSSRLFQHIREDLGLVYSVYSYPSFYTCCGTFTIYAGASPQKANEVLTLIQNEVAAVKKNGIHPAEVNKAKAMLRNAYLLALESPTARMHASGRSILHLGYTRTHEEELHRINNISVDDIQEVTALLLSEPVVLSVLGRAVDIFN